MFQIQAMKEQILKEKQEKVRKIREEREFQIVERMLKYGRNHRILNRSQSPELEYFRFMLSQFSEAFREHRRQCFLEMKDPKRREMGKENRNQMRHHQDS